MMGAVTDENLAHDIDAVCRLTGEFTLRSGQVSSEYFDKYLFEADPLLLARVAREMIQLVPQDTDLLGGLEMGGIPLATSLPDVDRLMALIAQDKKVKRGKLTFILVRGIGNAFVENDVDPAEVRAFLAEQLSSSR